MDRAAFCACDSSSASIATESGPVQIVWIESAMDVGQKLRLFSGCRIRDANLHEKAIQLRFGQWIRALELDRDSASRTR